MIWCPLFPWLSFRQGTSYKLIFQYEPHNKSILVLLIVCLIFCYYIAKLTSDTFIYICYMSYIT